MSQGVPVAALTRRRPSSAATPKAESSQSGRRPHWSPNKPSSGSAKIDSPIPRPSALPEIACAALATYTRSTHSGLPDHCGLEGTLLLPPSVALRFTPGVPGGQATRVRINGNMMLPLIAVRPTVSATEKNTRQFALQRVA